MSNPAIASHDEMAAKIANKYEIVLMSSMFENVIYADHMLSSMKIRLSVWLYIDLTQSTSQALHGHRHGISHAKPETTLSEQTDSAWLER
jgi:hypothetical protein